MEQYELIIIGAGPAGLTAGIYGTRSGLKTLILEEKIPGGMVSISPWIENYLGFPEGIRGDELAEKMLRQCRKFGAEIHDLERVVSLDLKRDEKTVETDKSIYSASAVIIASGSEHKRLEVPGEDEFQGRGVSYCAVCDGAFFKGRRVLIVGGGNTAVMSAIHLANIASEVYLAHRRDRLRAEEAYMRSLDEQGVRLLLNTEVREIRGDSNVRGVVLHNNKTGKTDEMKIDGVFICVGEAPRSEFAREAGVEVDERGYIIVDKLQRTSIRGVYAVGDITDCPVKQIGTAVGQAVIAATEAFGYIKKPYYYRERSRRG